MATKPQTYFNWSTGKDSAMALYHLLKNDTLHISRLLTTVNAHHNRVSMHGLRRTLMNEQAASIGIPLQTVELPEQPTMEDYDMIMRRTVEQLQDDGYMHCGFGDIFLEDLRAYREEKLTGITCHFPLWKRDTSTLIKEFIQLGFKATILCVDTGVLDGSFVGRDIDEHFLNDIPPTVDPCGENGDFHTFCYDGPIFSYPIKFKQGEKVLRKYLKPKQEDSDT